MWKNIYIFFFNFRAFYRVASILAELYVDFKVDNGGLAKLECLESAEEGSRPGLFLQAREDGVGGAAPVVQQDDGLVVDARLGHQVPGEDVEDRVAVQLNPEVQVFAKTGAGNVVALKQNK